MKVAIIAASLNVKSNSRIMAVYLKKMLAIKSIEVDFIDLRDYPLPLCDGGQSADHPKTMQLAGKLASANVIVIASPVYNYGLNAAIKNVVELTGKKVWTNKVVGFICAAGGKGSYMSVLPFANSLMLDFHCLILPRFIYITEDLTDEPNQIPSHLQKRIKDFSDILLKYGSV